MIGAASAVRFPLELWDDIPSVANAVRLIDVVRTDIVALRIRYRRSGDHELSLSLTANSPAVTAVAVGCVLRVKVDDAPVTVGEWDVRTIARRWGAGGAVLEVTAKPLLLRFGRAPHVVLTLATGQELHTVQLAQRTAQQILEDFVVPQLQVRFPWVALGDVESAKVFPTFAWEDAAPLAIVRTLEQGTESIAALEPVDPDDLSAGYVLVLRLAQPSSADPVDIVSVATASESTQTLDLLEMVNELYVRGERNADGSLSGIEEAAWKVTAISGADVDLEDPQGGDGPVQFADQVNGLYLPGVTPEYSTTVVDAELTLAFSTGTRFRVGSGIAVNFAVGQRVRVVGTGAFASARFEAVVLSVDTGDDDVYLGRPVLGTDFAIGGTTGGAPFLASDVQFAAAWTGSTITRLQNSAYTVVTDSVRVSQTTSRVTVADASALSVDQLVSFRASASGLPVLTLRNPASIAQYGGPLGTPYTGSILLPDKSGQRNYAPNPFVRDYASASVGELPAGWDNKGGQLTSGVLSGTSGDARVQRNADPAFIRFATPYSVRLFNANVAPFAIGSAALLSDPIYLEPVIGTQYLVLMVSALFVKFPAISVGLATPNSFNVALVADGTGFGAGASVSVLQPIGASFNTVSVTPLVNTPALGAWVDITTAPVDVSRTTSRAVRVYITAAMIDCDIYVGPVMLARGSAKPNRYVEFADATAMWQEGNGELARRSSPIANYRVKTLDLYRHDRTRFPYSQLTIGRRGRLTIPALGVSGAQLECVELDIDALQSKNTETQFDSLSRRLTALSTGSVTLSGAPLGAGQTGLPTLPGGTGGGGTLGGGPATPPAPPTTGGGSAWVGYTFHAPPAEIGSSLAMPSTSVERWFGARKVIDFTGAQKFYASGVRVAPGPENAAIVFRGSLDNGSTWIPLNGDESDPGPALRLDTADAPVEVAISPTFQNQRALVAAFWENGDDDTEAEVADLTLMVQYASGETEAVDVPGDAGCGLSPDSRYGDDHASDATFADFLARVETDNQYTEYFGDDGDEEAGSFDATLQFNGQNVPVGTMQDDPELTGIGHAATFADPGTDTPETYDDVWSRLRFRIEAGFVPDGSVLQEGLQLLELHTTGGATAGVYARFGRLWLDTVDDNGTEKSIDLTTAFAAIGTARIRSLVLQCYRLGADELGVDVYLGDACQSPLPWVNGTTFASSDPDDEWEGMSIFDPSTLNSYPVIGKRLWRAQWEYADGSASANPYDADV